MAELFEDWCTADGGTDLSGVVTLTPVAQQAAGSLTLATVPQPIAVTAGAFTAEVTPGEYLVDVELRAGDDEVRISTDTATQRIVVADLETPQRLRELIDLGVVGVSPLAKLNALVSSWLDGNVNTEVSQTLITEALTDPESEPRQVLDGTYAPIDDPRFDGLGGGVSSWDELEDKPPVIAAGANQAAARAAIGAVDQAAITAAINAVIDAAPGALDTLNELAAALGDDPNFAATIAAELGGKLEKGTTGWRVYATREDAGEVSTEMLTYAQESADYSLAQRGAGGTLRVGDAVDDDHAVTKSQFDAADRVALHTLFRPMTGVLPAGVLTTNTFATAEPTDYTSIWGTRWDSPNFNKQGQNQVAVVPANLNAGCVNDANGRHVGATPMGSVHDVEFLFTGSKLDVMIQSFGYCDMQVYIEHEGQMMKASALPMTVTHEGYVYRRLRFAENSTRRIRLIMPSVYFVQVIHEQSAVVRRSPDRPLIVTTGDSYFDSSGSRNEGSARSFATFGIIDQIIEQTGFAVARCGQGGTGYFNNGAGAATDTEVGTINTSRFGSTFRMTKYGLFLGATAKPLLFMVNGTINDGELAGGQAGMAARATALYDAVAGLDPLVSIVPIGPEPMDDSYASGVHATNRLGLIDAANAHPRVIGFIDANNPTSPFWTGTGYEGTPATSQQAQLVGADQIHPNWYGHKHYGQQIVAAISAPDCAQGPRRTPLLITGVVGSG